MEIPYTYKAKLIRVVDGDTLDLEVDLGMSIYHKIRVRLYGLNAPETFGVLKDSEEYKLGMACKARLEALVTPITATEYLVIDTMKDKKEKYGRYLAVVHSLEDPVNHVWVNVNDTLIKEGLAKPATY